MQVHRTNYTRQNHCLYTQEKNSKDKLGKDICGFGVRIVRRVLSFDLLNSLFSLVFLAGNLHANNILLQLLNNYTLTPTYHQGSIPATCIPHKTIFFPVRFAVGI